MIQDVGTYQPLELDPKNVFTNHVYKLLILTIPYENGCASVMCNPNSFIIVIYAQAAMQGPGTEEEIVHSVIIMCLHSPSSL